MSRYITTPVALDAWQCLRPNAGIYTLTTELTDTLVAHANVAVRESASHMVVFLPGAQDEKSTRRVPFFHRWSWQEDLPEMHVVALGDPSIALDERILGGWFMHPEIDLVAELASMVRRIAETLNVAPENITFHGSSLGGYGAIGMAAHLRGASAISEIPQIDVQRWKNEAAIQLLGEVVGQPLSEFRTVFPERVHVYARLRYAGVVPPLLLITNPGDPTYALQQRFMAALPSLSKDCEVLGEQKLVESTTVRGHKALPKAEVLELLRRTR